MHKRTVANLSQWEPARIEALRRALRGDFDHLRTADPVCGPVFGLLYALKSVADELGITAALGRSRLGKRGAVSDAGASGVAAVGDVLGQGPSGGRGAGLGCV